MNTIRVPEQKDFVDYAEGMPLKDPEVQKQVLQMLAISPELRQQIAELKKELYLVNMQIPEFEPDVNFSQEMSALAESWLKLSLSRRFAFAKFLQAKEFFAFTVLLIFGVLVAVFLLLSSKV